MADLKQLANDLAGLAQSDLQELTNILKADYEAAVVVVHKDIFAGGATVNSSGDPVQPPTGPKP